MTIKAMLSATAVAFSLILALPARAEPPAAATTDGAFSPAQGKAIERMIHDYIVAHPEVLQEAEAALAERAEASRLDKIRTVITANGAALYHQTDDMVVGNEQGDVTLVEFFDYNCPYCKRGWPDIEAHLKADPKLRVVLKPMPYLSKDSGPIARLAVAAKRQGKFLPFHEALLANQGQTTEAVALKIAARTGLDVVRLKRDAALPEISSVVDRALALSKSLNLEGTPFFFIGDRYISGAPDDLFQQIDHAAADTRKGDCKAC